jgi:nickel/cobalt exporter
MQPHASPHAQGDCCDPTHGHPGRDHHGHDHHGHDHHGHDHHGHDHHGHGHDHGHDHHAHAQAAAGDDCDCAGHRLKARSQNGGKATFLATLLPILACALCPVCISTYAAVLSALGVTLAFTEGQHALLLGVAVLAALGVALWKAQRSRRYTALGLTALGCGLLVLSQLFNDNKALGLLGIGALLSSLVYERVVARRAARLVPVPVVSR